MAPSVSLSRVALALATMYLALSAQTAGALDVKLVTIENTTGVPAADLHVTFAGAGGNVFVDPNSVFAPGCPTPAVTSNPPVVTNEVVIDWGVECVLPGNSATFVVRSANGPLTVVSAFWTNSLHVNIGGGGPDDKPIPDPGPDLFAPLKFFSWYVGGGRTYTDWATQSHDQFVRECCRAPRWCFADVYFCPFPNRFKALFELGPWYYITTVHTYTPPRYTYFSWLIWGIVPPPIQKPKGPPPAGHPLPHGYDPIDIGLDPRFSDDGGHTFRKTDDFTSAFIAFTDSLAIHPASIGATPTFYPVPAYFTKLGQRWMSASTALTKLITEINIVRTNEPSSLMNSIYSDVINVQSSTAQIAAELLTGNPYNTTPFLNMNAALLALSADITQVSPSARFDNAAALLSDAANYAGVATTYMGGGWADTVNVAGFEYAMTSRLPGSLYGFAKSMWPHTVLKLHMPSYYSWAPSTIEGAHVIVTRQPSGTTVLDYDLPILDTGEVIIPASRLQDGERIRIWAKLPTFLSVQTDMYYHDGARAEFFQLYGGDANGDDCVNSADASVVGANYGAGGWHSPVSPPPADVNGDGTVTVADLSIVGSNNGKCGPLPVTGVVPLKTPRLIDVSTFPNPSSGLPTVRFVLADQAEVAITIYNVRGERVSYSLETYPQGENNAVLERKNFASGVYFCRLRVTGPSAPLERVVRFTVLK